MEAEGEEVTVTITSGGKCLQLCVPGREDILEFHSVWLRYNCSCPQCSYGNEKQEGTQKLTLPHQLDTTTTITAVEISGSKVNMEWSCGHRGFLGINWLINFLSKSKRAEKIVSTSLPEITAEEVLGSEEGLWRWLKTLSECGMCLITGLSTDHGSVQKITDLFYGSLNTVYGQTIDIIMRDDPAYIAYSPSALPFHTDMVYYRESCGLHLLHCKRNDDCLEGGLSMLLDTYPILKELKAKHPQHFATLTRVPATFIALHSGSCPADMSHQKPHITLEYNSDEVKTFTWSPLQEGVLNVPKEDVVPYYEAYSCLAKMFEGSPNKIYHKFNPGDVMTLDNWRVMHGRTGIKGNGGERALELAFVSMDEYLSRFNILRKKLTAET